MKSMTKTAMTFCCAALLALGAAACSDECGTGPIRSEEANLSSDAGGSSDLNSSPEGTSGEGGSEKVSSSSSFYYSYSGPTCCGKDALYPFEFDPYRGFPHNSAMFVDDSRREDSASAETALYHAEDGNYYPAAQGWTDSSGWTCPRGEPVEEPEGSGNWVSPCYWGWNDGDMFTDSSAKVGVKLKKFVDEAGWGHVNGGFIYILDGWNFSYAEPVDIGYELIVEVKAKAGMPVKIYGWDKVAYNDSTEGLPKYGFAGTGAWQRVIVPVDSIRPRNGATNTFDPAHVLAIGLQYELSATEPGQPCDLCSDEILDLEWRLLWRW